MLTLNHMQTHNLDQKRSHSFITFNLIKLRLNHLLRLSPDLCPQGGQSDSGMGLSSDNMQTLKRLESLAGRPLSIMALAYVCCTAHHRPTRLSSDTQHTQKQSAKDLLGNLLVVLECRPFKCQTLRLQFLLP